MVLNLRATCCKDTATYLSTLYDCNYGFNTCFTCLKWHLGQTNEFDYNNN